MKKIGFLGPVGTYSEEAALNFSELYEKNTAINKEDLLLHPCSTIAGSLLSVANSELDMCVVPIENLIEGPVNSTLDILAQESSLYINCDFKVKIENYLLALTDNPSEITTIISHPQPIGQCSQFINQNFPNCKILYSNSTSEAAKQVKNSDGTLAAIASPRAAKQYNLNVLRENIQDIELNYTRFICASRELNVFNKNLDKNLYKTSIVFSTQNKPGSLYKILSIFDLWDINLTKIESRPSKTTLGEYIFFVDVEGSVENSNVSDALKIIKRKTSFLKLLGSFPSY
jgi:prephenate dehydratase